jgi:hypothetical protein
MLARIHTLALGLWGALAGGAGAGFLARDVLGLGQPVVALAWLLGAATPVAALARSRLRCPLARRPRAPDERARGRPPDQRRSGHGPDQRGQAALELTMLLLLASLSLGALAAVALRFDGRDFGSFLAFRVLCAIEGECHDGDKSLTRAYGGRYAALVRELAPNLVYEPGEPQLPVDWRDCRRTACAEAPDEPGLDVHLSHAGERATAFTRVLRRDGRTYIQYWLYYPDSVTVWAGSDALWNGAWRRAQRHGLVRRPPAYPGSHGDDWEAYAVRIDPGGRAWVRASSHSHWQGCKRFWCRNDWTARTGWTRVSRGSHAGHIPLRHELRGPPLRVEHVPLLPGRDLNERTTSAEGLRLVPLETLDTRGYRSIDEDIAPPWKKDAYWDPESDES